MNLVPSFVGLAVAWGGIALLLSPAYRLLGPPELLRTKVLGQLGMWVLCAAVVGIVLFWEKEPLASIGIRGFRWQSLLWGFLLAAVMIYLVIPLETRGLRIAGISGFDAGMAKVLGDPVWLRIIAVVTAGVVEDVLFLGYAFTRVSRLAGNVWVGGLVAAAASALLHYPHWGMGPVLTFFVAGIIGVAFFVWRRDLVANIVAHVTVDGMGLVIMPVLAGLC